MSISIEQQVMTLVQAVGSRQLQSSDTIVPARLALDANWQELGLDELDRFELIIKCEDHFSIEISDVEADSCITLQDLVRLIADRTAALHNVQ